MHFQPFRQKDFDDWVRKNPPDPQLIAVTSAVGDQLKALASALDVIPEQGAVAFRTSNGMVWEIRIAPSDAPYLISEGKKP